MRILRYACASLCVLVLTTLVPARAEAQATPGPCTTGVLPSGALSLVCVPVEGWNRQLVAFAHGYVDAREPLQFAHLTLQNGTSLPLLVQSLGFAFATTSYRQNGLAILEGVDDMRELVAAFSSQVAVPLRTFAAGVSEGGLVAALLAERAPELFTGALAACGPIGSFRAQIQYFGDFRVLFDYYFPGIIPGNAIAVPPPVIANWESQYVPAVLQALAANPAVAVELLTVAGVPFVPGVPATIAQSVLGLLSYSIHATTDARQKLGGNPYGNNNRIYTGSSNDAALNEGVQRFTASPRALEAIRAYETSGDLTVPLVALHTTGDEIMPIGHLTLYGSKVHPTGRGAFFPAPIARYGHCNFTTNEVLAAVGALVAIP